MPTPTRSWRQSTGRIPAAAAASITGVVGYVLRNSTPSRFMISAIASTTFIAVPLSLVLAARPEPHRLAPELLGDEVPAECRVMRRAVRVAMESLDRLRVEHGAGAAALEQAVDGADTEPRDERLVAPVADAVELRESFTPRRPIEDLADVLPVECSRRVDLGGGLGQPELERHGVGRTARTGHA